MTTPPDTIAVTGPGRPTGLLLAALCAALLAAGCAQQATRNSAGVPAVAAPAVQANPARDWHARQGVQVQRRWGIDVVGVRPAASGWMLEFRYRVLDAAKAKVVNAQLSKAYVVDEATNTHLAVPAMENVGELRQTATPQVGREYFILFGNPNRLVRSGGRVTVVVGSLSIEGLTVE
jgi:hypothetical protein